MSETIEFTEDQCYTPLYPERTEPLHAMLTNCGHQRVTTHLYSWDGLKRGTSELVIWQYTLHGEGEFRIGNRIHPLPAGRGFLGIVPEDHCYRLPESSSSWEFLFVSIHGSELLRLAGEFRQRHGAVCDFARGEPTVRAAERLLTLFREKQVHTRHQASALAYDFMMTLLDKPQNGPDEHNDDFRQRVHRFCMSNLDRPLSVADLAEAAGCSRWHFSRRFQEAEGKSPHAFLVELKMRLALRLLQTSTLSIKEIAGRCGFNDDSYFCKVFKQVYRTPPAGLRNGASPSAASNS